MHQVIERLAFGRRTSATQAVVPWRTAVLVGRVLLSSIFILSGIQKVLGWSGTLDYVASQGLQPAWLFAGGAAAVEIIAGLSVLTGTFARFGALALFLFLIPTTLLFHDFWTFGGQERQMQMANFLKNLAIMGGLSLVIGFGAGNVSVDQRLSRTTQERHSVP